MENIIRIQRVEIENMQNIKKGFIDFSKYKGHKANITGIYGQNGSGKTSFIRSLAILKCLLSGEVIKKEYIDRITAGESETILSFEFSFQNKKDDLKKLFYKVHIEKAGKPTELAEEASPLVISRESLSYKVFQKNSWSPLEKILELKKNSQSVALPKSREKEFSGGNKNIQSKLQIANGVANRLGTSFIFSKELFSIFNEHGKNSPSLAIILALKDYARQNLFVIENRDSGLINLNAGLPFSFKLSGAMGTLVVALENSSTLSPTYLDIINKLISDMNRVLEKIIPGLTIALKELGKQLMKNGNLGVNVELVSIRKKTEIPLRYESDGIKKIISVLHMLIETYNNPSMTLAIDELDSGIFEYMLGELLQSLEQRGEGQLIYTSHNLRPMELLDKNSVVVSTANPNNRYIRLKNIKTNNNTKNVFLRDIVLDGQSETIYEPTNIFEIKHAFRSLRRNTHAS